MISSYQEKLQDFYKMRDTLISEGFNYPENIEIFNNVEKREIALEIIKEMLDDDLTEKLNANSRKIFKDIFDNLPKEKQDLLKSVLLY